MPTPRSGGRRRYLATSATGAAFTLTLGTMTSASFSGGHLCVAGNAALPIIPLNGFRGCDFWFFGVGSNNHAFTYRLWTVQMSVPENSVLPNPNPGQVLDIGLECYIADTSTATLSSSAIGVTGGSAATTEYFADTLTMTLATTATTPKGPATVTEAARLLGVASVYSPADDATPARLSVPDMGDAWGFVLDFDLGSGTNANALYSLTR